MKGALFVFIAFLSSLVVIRAQARAPETAPPPPPPIAPPVYPAVPAAPQFNATTYVYDQKPVGGRRYLIAPEQAQAIMNRFKEEYKQMGAPKVVIVVNRELIDQSSGLKLTSHKQVVETSRTSRDPGTAGEAATAAVRSEATQRLDRAASTNIYRVHEPKEMSMADRQTVRDVERLFGRPLRLAGVHLADQRIAAQLIGSRPLDALQVQAEGEQAQKDREALAKVADVVLEVLVTSQETVIGELAGDRTYRAPDIQATAIRLSDSKILGQATAADLIGQGPSAGQAAKTFGIREITEATALSLMEDIMLK